MYTFSIHFAFLIFIQKDSNTYTVYDLYAVYIRIQKSHTQSWTIIITVGSRSLRKNYTK